MRFCQAQPRTIDVGLAAIGHSTGLALCGRAPPSLVKGRGAAEARSRRRRSSPSQRSGSVVRSTPWGRPSPLLFPIGVCSSTNRKFASLLSQAVTGKPHSRCRHWLDSLTRCQRQAQRKGIRT